MQELKELFDDLLVLLLTVFLSVDILNRMWTQEGTNNTILKNYVARRPYEMAPNACRMLSWHALVSIPRRAQELLSLHCSHDPPAPQQTFPYDCVRHEASVAVSDVDAVCCWKGAHWTVVERSPGGSVNSVRVEVDPINYYVPGNLNPFPQCLVGLFATHVPIRGCVWSSSLAHLANKSIDAVVHVNP